MESKIISCGNDQRRRSNNALEGWNRLLNDRMPHKPTLIRFVYNLKREAKYQEMHYFQAPIVSVIRQALTLILKSNCRT